ncbi:unnamed protein product [Ilex paraguariensis]|uniref:Strictosidine synthase conserved region domain-containing protein n=1 Tax=Ilex paraguariensis TaxID=185542 RepID=A0ABC8RSA4_9AQUA
MVISSDPYPYFTKLPLPTGVTGPDCIAFDPLGGGPYAGVGDGRILKWQGPGVGFQDFAYTSPNRTKDVCDGTNDPHLGPTCGRPYDLSFHILSGNLYIADAFLGLFVVGSEGGLATKLATSAEGVPFRFLSSVDIDQLDGTVYFSDISETFDLSNVTQPNFKPDSRSGRLLKYDPIEKEVIVLMGGISGSTGVALSVDSTFIALSEFLNDRILKFHLKGLKANTAEVLLNINKNPNKIKKTKLGDFWVAEDILEEGLTPVTKPQGIRFNAFGEVLETKDFSAQYDPASLHTIKEYNGALYTGSRSATIDFVGIYTYTTTDELSSGIKINKRLTIVVS